MAVKIRPLHDRLIVDRIEDTEQQVGGIIIPDTAKEKPQQGKVIAAGKGKVKDDGSITPLDVKAGDRIIEQIIRQAAEYIGVAVAGVVNLLAPDVVILGGGLVEAMPELFVETVAERRRQRRGHRWRHERQLRVRR